MAKGKKVLTFCLWLNRAAEDVILSSSMNFSTITAEIHARSLANFYGQYAERHMNLKFMRRVASWIHSYFDNVMTKFMINNRTDAEKTDVKLLSLCLKL